METSSPEQISSQRAWAAGSNTPPQNRPTVERRACPVFVVGCHRSGTNLLYDTLLSAGGFAVYRGYLPVYKMLIPRFGTFAHIANRRRAMETWVRSKGYRRTGLDAEQLTAKVLDECQTGGDFIRIVMGGIARSQQTARWAVYDPDNLLYIARIKAEIPESLFIHIIRDGRDVALSLKEINGFKPLPWNQGQGLLPSALYWEWMLRKGRQQGLCIPADYIEVRYEELVSAPRTTLERLGEFLDHDLDYDRIRDVGLGSLRQPNSSFSQCGESPVNRWKNKLNEREVASVEAIVGEYLEELGYRLTSPRREPGLREKGMRAFYFGLLNSKLWLKTQTPAGRLANLEALELSNPVEPAESE